MAVRGGGVGRASKVCLLPFVGGIKRGGDQKGVFFFRGGSEGPICALGNQTLTPIQFHFVIPEFKTRLI